MSIVDVKEIVENKRNSLKREILDLRDKGIIPKLAVILANDVEASRIYVSRKRKLCQELGIEATFKEISWNAKEIELEAKNIDCIWNGMTISEEVLKDIATWILSLPKK